MESKIKKYIVGAKDELAKQFPGYKENDIRYSLDGSLAIYEVMITEQQLDAIAKKGTLSAYSGKEVLDMLHSSLSAGIWYEAIQPEQYTPKKNKK